MRKILLAFLLLFPLISFGQKEGQALADSLLAVLPNLKEDTLKVGILNQLSSEYFRIDTDKGLQYAQQSLILSKKLDWQEGMAMAYNNYGKNYAVLSNYKLALFYFNKALKLSISEKTKSDLLDGISAVYLSLDNTPKALEYAFSALKIRESIHYTKKYAQSNLNIGTIYSRLSNYHKAIFYYKKALQINSNETKLHANIFYNLGIAYTALGQHSEALACYQKGLKISEKIKQLFYKKSIWLQLRTSSTVKKNTV